MPFNDPIIFREVVDYSVDSLRDVDFNTLVFRGFSGALVGPVVALELGKRWALIRKPHDRTHSCYLVEGEVFGDYVIIDDFIETGDTIKAIRDIVEQRYAVSCKGVVLYREDWFPRHLDDGKKMWEEIIHLPILNWPES
jgi:adenine/guanine phosphoribosyltransferase-like PRPP-binding protein